MVQNQPPRRSQAPLSRVGTRGILEAMPELPEVETVRRGLVDLLGRGSRIETAEIRRRDLRIPVPPRLPRALAGQDVLAVDRRAKYLLWRLPDLTLINHLGMTGSWRAAPPGDERRHDHCVLHLADGRRLVYHDPRRFGMLTCSDPGCEAELPNLARLGPEPLDPEAFHLDHLAAACARRPGPIKAAIMTGAVVVGVGNIYAAEALYRAGIRPQARANAISRRRLGRLVDAIRAVLVDAIAAGGSTIRDFRQAGGSGGYFQADFAVYGRGGEACRCCGATLKQAVVAQRATVWCPKCQR